MKSLQRSGQHEYRLWKRKLLHLTRELLNFKCNLNVLLFLVVVSMLICVVFKLLNLPIVDDFISSGTDKIDWHDWSLIDDENARTGIGEHGKAAYLRFYPPSSKLINDTHGYNGYLSDKIALNRSLPDLRPKE